MKNSISSTSRINYVLNLKNIKQSATNLSNFLKSKNYTIPHNILLDSLSKVFFYKNWNTLEGVITNPQIINELPVQKAYLFEIQANISSEEFLSLVKLSFSEAKAHLQVANYLHNDKHIHLELDLSKDDSNILTAMFLVCDKLKKQNIDVKNFDYCRVICEKESLMDYFNNPTTIQDKKLDSSNQVNNFMGSFMNIMEGVDYAAHPPKAEFYVKGKSLAIDQFFKKHEYTDFFLENTTWWEIVDFLFFHKELELAREAQMYAVPLLNDSKDELKTSKDELKTSKDELKNYHEGLKRFYDQEAQETEAMIRTINAPVSEKNKKFYEELARKNQK